MRRRFLTEWQHLTTIQSSDRRWQMPIAAALACGLPLLVGASLNHLDFGLVSSLGGLVFLYLGNTPLYHRMVVLMAAAFALTACFALGTASQFVPIMRIPVLVFATVLVTMACRYFQLGPPGSLFFVMAASIGAYTPLRHPDLMPQQVGLLFMGALLACLIAFVYSVDCLRQRAPQPAPHLPKASFDFVVFDAVVIGAFVGISLGPAQLLQLERPYWVPVSCLAVIQGASLRAVWNRKVHRVLGTGVGMLVAWGLLLLPLNAWGMALTMMALSFVIEMAVVRHYGFAVVFITPLTILLAEATNLGKHLPSAVIEARFLDTLLGCVIGLIGGICLHSPRFRQALGRPMRRLIPARLIPSQRLP